MLEQLLLALLCGLQSGRQGYDRLRCCTYDSCNNFQYTKIDPHALRPDMHHHFCMAII